MTSNLIRFKPATATFPLIGINVIIFFLQSILGKGFTDMFVLGASTFLVEPWTLITSMFLHGSPAHLFFNMFVLFMFGPLIESTVGAKRFLIGYFASGILGGIVFSVIGLMSGFPQSALGASGGVMGILGMTIVLLPQLRVLFFFVIPMSMRTAGIIIALVDLLGIFGLGIPGVANTAHLGGLAFGLLYAIYIKNFRKNFWNKRGKKRKNKGNSHNSKHPNYITVEDADEYLRKF